MHIICDRCGLEVTGSEGDGWAAGFYQVWEGTCWHKYSEYGEKVVCDSCMWKSPLYSKDYGVVPVEKICS